jgi:hypothetical protein
MALDREAKIVAGHPAAVVDDTDEPPAARLDHDIDAAGARVKRIFDEFLHDGGRPLDDLARRDAVDEYRIETTDRHADLTPKERMILLNAYAKLDLLWKANAG